MANTPLKPMGRSGTLAATINTTAVISLGNAEDAMVSQWVVQIVPTGLTGGFVPKGTVIGSGLTGSNLDTLLLYEASSEAAVSTASPVGTASVYYIPADGLDVFLDCTVSAGSFVVYARPVAG